MLPPLRQPIWVLPVATRVVPKVVLNALSQTSNSGLWLAVSEQVSGWAGLVPHDQQQEILPAIHAQVMEAATKEAKMTKRRVLTRSHKEQRNGRKQHMHHG